MIVLMKVGPLFLLIAGTVLCLLLISSCLVGFKKAIVNAMSRKKVSASHLIFTTTLFSISLYYLIGNVLQIKRMFE